MRMSAAFPSEFLKAADLDGRQVPVVADRVEMQKVGDDNKPVLYFAGKEKGLVLNKTNANMIATVYGDEMDDWQGAELILYETKVQFQNQMVDAIRVKIPPRKPVRQAAPARSTINDKPVVTQQYSETNPPPIDVDDDIPF